MLLVSSTLMTGAIATAALVMMAVVGVALATSARRHPAVDDVHLPQGADAALWSIVEAVPDPRNHLALTRDLSGEVRITEADRAAAAAMASDRPTVSRQPVGARSGVRVIELRDAVGDGKTATGNATPTPEPVPIRTREPEDPEVLREREVTAQVFFAGEPRLTRF